MSKSFQSRLGLTPIAAFVLALASGFVMANGTVQQTAGTLTVQKPDGSVRALSNKSEIQKGDVVETQKDSYAQIKFADGGTMTMKPNSRIKVEEYVFNEKDGKSDKSTLALIKGGMRFVTGLIGKRGDQDAFKMNTATATIGIRGTTFNVDDCVTTSCERRRGTRVGQIFGGHDVASLDNVMLDMPPDAQLDPAGFDRWVSLDRALSGAGPDPFGLIAQNSRSKCATGRDEDCADPAVFVSVSDGEIVVRNQAGETSFKAGQFGSIPDVSIRPRTLPGDPGLPIYQPPATFFQAITGTGVGARNTQCIIN
jgi:FecR protein